ncbi:type VI secretion system baseplate subunit TssG [Aestuariicella sp. G3-2]|uniref:type VI secretion system baseplate subunit TssG n=1 Tax=Pseudomaricurvus albidus TaxID=2842452 RepID=UPI001C0B8AAC|nr:type VI secretion system baseplate subunit TssG [Aestuariicella albida]MBU3070336.1 type VI secretion system baseplate subunit TssG [Aestuariicella albida]
MATTRRRKSLAVVDQLATEPYRFDFFQAVRLLERISALDPREYHYATEPVAQDVLPSREVVRFKNRPQLSFQAADIEKISEKLIDDESDSHRAEKQWEMLVNFMGLTGSQGVMPYYLSEIVLQELRKKNSALKDYLDLFNHRAISMYYQAWHKYQLPANFERSQQQGQQRNDLFTDALLSLAGLGTKELSYRLPVPDEALAGFCGHLSRPVCTAVGLKGMIKQYFGIDVTIKQFQGQWQDLTEDVQTRLPGPEAPRGLNNVLGTNAVLGSSCYQIQNKFTVEIDPLPYQEFMNIAPGSRKLEALKSFIHFSVGSELDFDIEVTLSDREVPPVQLSNDPDYQPLLGWNSHMSHQTDDEQMTLIRLSQDIDPPEDSLPLTG